ncbi:hypothetical protein AGOR_G00140240 [Albula goreensis]|uniref:Uncharacterized protein n=1 Tax=Albula goreensis TaxID=1534307 RepID=A0A8T3DF25_9TELE|nr:hypothetical protein AGOR_G00140240 [Albula goreensis]
MRFRSQKKKMASIWCLHQLLFSLILLLALRCASSSTTQDTMLASASSTQYSTITTETFTSPTQEIEVTMETSPSSTEKSTVNTDIQTTPTQYDTTDTATTLLPVTTDSASKTTLDSTSTEGPTSESTQTNDTATNASVITKPTITSPGSVTVGEEKPHGLSHSEKVLTAFFSVLLVLPVLSVAAYSFLKCRQKNLQFSHRPLYNSSEETVDNFAPPDDTLVISGGLYDGPQLFNPAMTADEDAGFQAARIAFGTGLTQFRLEFLPEEQGRFDGRGPTGFETFHPPEGDV